MDWARARRILLTVGFAAAAILWLSERARPQETAAPQTPATLSTYINTYIPDNTSGFVTPAYLRAVLHSMNASYINSVSTTGVFGPGSSTAGHLATWNNTGGSLLADSPINATILSVVANPPNVANGLPVLNGSGFLATAQGGLGLAPNASAASAMANAPCATSGFITQPGTWVSGNAPKIGVSGCLTDAGNPAVLANQTQYGVMYGGGAGVQPGATAPGSAGQILFGTATTPQFATPASTQANPGNPTGTTSTAGVMMGLNTTITPNATGRVLIVVSVQIANSNSSYFSSVSLRTGTGSTPTNGAALTGTQRDIKYGAGGNTGTFSMPLSYVLTGLTLGTAVWIDCGLATSNASGTATLQNVSISAIEF